MSQQPQYQVPRILWESLEATLYAASRAFVRSLAEDVLEVPPQDLLKAVFPSKEAFKVALYETEEQRECMAFVKQNEIAARCRHPVFPGQNWCSKHQFERPTLQLRIEPPVHWRPLKHSEPDLPPLWLNATNEVIDANGCVRGDFADGRLTFYDSLQ
jgi:hypothetical protein